MNIPNVDFIYINPLDLEKIYTKLVRLVFQSPSCPLVLSEEESNQNIKAFSDKDFLKREAKKGKDVYVTVIYNVNNQLNFDYINKKNKGGLIRSNMIEAVFTLIFRIGKSRSAIRSLGSQMITDQEALSDIILFAKKALALNNNNSDLNTTTLELITHKNKQYRVNLELSSVEEETDIEDENALSTGDQFQYYVKNVTFKTIILIL